jgi:PPOX class probable F420-dependent enzyme
MASTPATPVTGDDPLAAFRSARYLSVTTFRRDGSRVATPVWFAINGDRLLAWTYASSGKVRRLRANPRAELAPCTVRGRPLRPPVAARAVLLPASENALVHKLLNRRYPVAKRLLAWYEHLTRVLRRQPPSAGNSETCLAFTFEPSMPPSAASPT